MSVVSVLIRSTGRAELAKALDSVAAQRYPHIEVLIVDAAGRGGLPLPERFPHPLREIVSPVPLRRSEAANRLLSEARGEFGLFLDDDDWLGADHLERLVAALAEAAHCQVAYAGVVCVEASRDGEGELRELRVFDEVFDPVRLMVENYIPIHAALFRLDAIRAQSGPRFDPAFDLYEDWDFWLQNLALGPFVHVPGVSAWYRIHGSSGAGVRVEEEDASIRALDAVIEKWRLRWSAEDWRRLFGLTRHAERLRQALEAADRDHRAALEEAQRTARAEREEAERRVAAAERRLVEERDALRAWYEGSRSWRVTRPLRATAGWLRERGYPARLRELRKSLAGRTLNLLTAAYRDPRLARVAAAVPPPLKRRLRNALMRGARPSVPQVSAGLKVLRPLGPCPRVTIVIPVYNHAAFLEQCIRSALDQTWGELEIVVVDDASPDPEVGRILGRLAGERRLRILRNETNQGICRTQNRALTASTGDVIGFLDCDDYLAPDAVERCMAHWCGDTVYLHSGRINVDDEGREVNRINFLSLPREDYFAENLRAMYATHFKLIRRDVFARVGLFDPRFDSAQDYEMLMRIAFHYPSPSFLHVPDFLYFHRLHGGQTTETQRARQDALTTRIQEEARLRDAIRRGCYGRFLSIIMLSYGKHSQTLKAIQGLKDTVKVPHEIILYDNGSAEETVAFIRAHLDGRFDGLKVFYGDRNLGPARGRRAALEKASGEWFIVFDNDEVPEPGWLEELLLRAESNDNVGAVCCRVAFPDESLQFSGGEVRSAGEGIIELGLHDRGVRYDDLRSCEFREVDWSPIGATLFTRNIAPYLHEGYPNVFEDAGVSFALQRDGLRLLNAPGALVWHEHITFRPDTEMSERYLRDRYNARLMLRSVASFYRENGLLIQDEYVWRENGLVGLSRDEIVTRLDREVAAPACF